MTDAFVITPVKDSIKTTIQTIESVAQSEGNFLFTIYNDFSSPDNKKILEQNSSTYAYNLINLEDITNSPSPNYNLVLQNAQKEAIRLQVPLIIIESDVIVKTNTISSLVNLVKELPNTGMIGAITTDENGNYNFPYEYEHIKSDKCVNTNHSLSFCCTLLSCELLKQFSFDGLSSKKDWYDITISRQSKKLGFENYLAKGLEVIHAPHSSRPWKKLKYSNPVKYYFNKYFKKLDRI